MSQICRPLHPRKPARVTTNAGTPTLAKKKPWRPPMHSPETMAMTTASQSLRPCVTLSTAHTAAPTPATEPTDRSISPSSRTKTMPVAMMPVPAM
jgi:hypothetical protein